jgi:hypothetical protein
VLTLVLLLGACAAGTDSRAQVGAGEGGMDTIAERYVRLVLSVGRHDAAYVDAYYGPEQWKTEIDDAEPKPLADILAIAAELRSDLAAVSLPTGSIEALRHTYLTTQLEALEARVRMMQGERLTFDEESKALYDAVAPTHPESYFEERLTALEALLPGDEPLSGRLERFRARFVIPPDRLDAVFNAAIEACRERTALHFELPEGESFVVEYVTDKSWSGYNWYQGGYHSLIQVNTDLPIHIDRAIDLACHEGYPGHHVYNVLREKNLYRDRGWVEATVYPLFSPQSLIAEGTANYGIEIAFPGDERVAYERDVLFPLAGLDASEAARYYQVLEATEALDYAGNEAARRYLDGLLDATATAEFLTRYALMPPARARQRVRFIDDYRSYVINYNLGRDLVRSYVEAAAGDDRDARWRVIGELLSSPRQPSGLIR